MTKRVCESPDTRTIFISSHLFSEDLAMRHKDIGLWVSIVLLLTEYFINWSLKLDLYSRGRSTGGRLCSTSSSEFWMFPMTASSQPLWETCSRCLYPTASHLVSGGLDLRFIYKACFWSLCWISDLSVLDFVYSLLLFFYSNTSFCSSYRGRYRCSWFKEK